MSVCVVEGKHWAKRGGRLSHTWTGLVGKKNWPPTSPGPKALSLSRWKWEAHTLASSYRHLPLREQRLSILNPFALATEQVPECQMKESLSVMMMMMNHPSNLDIIFLPSLNTHTYTQLYLLSKEEWIQEEESDDNNWPLSRLGPFDIRKWKSSSYSSQLFIRLHGWDERGGLLPSFLIGIIIMIMATGSGVSM